MTLWQLTVTQLGCDGNRWLYFACFADHHDWVVNKDEIIACVWRDAQVTDDSLVQCISEIRKAIGDSEHRILKTIPRRGYLLVSDVPQKLQTAADVHESQTDESSAVWHTGKSTKAFP